MNKTRSFLVVFGVSVILACLVDSISAGRTVVRQPNSVTKTGSNNKAVALYSENEEEDERPIQKHAVAITKPTRQRTSIVPSLQKMLPQVQHDAMQMLRGFLNGVGWEVSGWELDLFEIVVGRVAKQLLINMQDFI